MNLADNLKQKLAALGIAALCFGYFASYIPYSMMTKMLTKGLFAGQEGMGFTGFELQPTMVLGSFVGMFTFLTAARWWKHATHSKVLGFSIPRPQWYTFISGICTAGQIITTTLAYTFAGISIVFAMLLMRGGVLIMAPIVDLVVKKRKRRIYWPSLVAAALAFGALIVAFSEKAGVQITVIAAIDIGLYLFGYFFRLFIMSNWAKSSDVVEKKRYFTEEQMVANPILLLTLFVVGLIGSQGSSESIPAQFWQGFTSFPYQGFFLIAFIAGIFSYGTGLFGSLIFLDKRENTFTVPANRVSSIMAGVIATYLLHTFYGQKVPSTYQLAGVAMIIAAIIFLMYRSMIEKRKTQLPQLEVGDASETSAASS